MRGTGISARTRKVVYERDSIDGRPCCIYCGRPYGIELAHYVSRARGGKGVARNLACLCRSCHEALDNGADTQKAKDIKETFRWWLIKNYSDWKEEEQVVNKSAAADV